MIVSPKERSDQYLLKELIRKTEYLNSPAAESVRFTSVSSILFARELINELVRRSNHSDIRLRMHQTANMINTTVLASIDYFVVKACTGVNEYLDWADEASNKVEAIPSHANSETQTEEWEKFITTAVHLSVIIRNFLSAPAEQAQFFHLHQSHSLFHALGRLQTFHLNYIPVNRLCPNISLFMKRCGQIFANACTQSPTNALLFAQEYINESFSALIISPLNLLSSIPQHDSLFTLHACILHTLSICLSEPSVISILLNNRFLVDIIGKATILQRTIDRVTDDRLGAKDDHLINESQTHEPKLKFEEHIHAEDETLTESTFWYTLISIRLFTTQSTFLSSLFKYINNQTQYNDHASHIWSTALLHLESLTQSATSLESGTAILSNLTFMLDWMKNHRISLPLPSSSISIGNPATTETDQYMSLPTDFICDVPMHTALSLLELMLQLSLTFPTSSSSSNHLNVPLFTVIEEKDVMLLLLYILKSSDNRKGGGRMEDERRRAEREEKNNRFELSAPAASPESLPFSFQTTLLHILTLLLSATSHYTSNILLLYSFLNHTHINPHQPLLREYSIIGIRRQCESELIREKIRGLGFMGIIGAEEWAKKGIDIRVDEETGKVKIGTSSRLTTALNEESRELQKELRKIDWNAAGEKEQVDSKEDLFQEDDFM